MDDSADIPQIIPDDKPTTDPFPDISKDPKIELPQVPPLPETNQISPDDTLTKVPIVEIKNESDVPVVPVQELQPKEDPMPRPDPFLMPPKPDPAFEPSNVVSPPTVITSLSSDPKRKPMKSIILSMLVVLILVGGGLGYYFFQKGGMDVGKKAVETIDSCADGAGGCCDQGVFDDGCSCRTSFNETCSIGNGACTSGFSCGAVACKPEGTCSGNWECCSGNCSNGVCIASQPPPSTGEPPTCSVTLIPGGSDGVCIKADGAQLTATACLNNINCVNGTRSVTYRRTVANCSEPSCSGVCGNAGEQRTLTVPAGQLCIEETVGCSVTNRCGNCQVDIDDYGERAWQDSGCITPIAPSPSPIPSLTVIPPSPTLTQTPISAACSAVSVKAVDVNSNDPINLSDLKVGDIVYFLVDLSGTVEDVAVDLRKAGVSLRTFYASQTAVSSWRTPDYTIAATGLYEVAAFVKINGVWK